MATITIDPVTRIEGHLAIQVIVDGRKVVRAYSSGEMFRGFELILRGRDPLDAQQITQRICGVCPVSHGTASILAQDNAYRINPPDNGRIIRNLILGANFIQSHILHFYHLSALDFVDIVAITQYSGNDPNLKGLKDWVKSQLSSNILYPAAPFLPRYEGKYIRDTGLNLLAIKHYLDALDMRRLAHEMGSIFGGKLPHAASLVPGGVTDKVSADKLAAFAAKLQELQAFIDNAYIPDVIEVAKHFPEYLTTGRGCGNFLAYGVFPENAGSSEQYLPGGVLTSGRLSDFDPEQITEDVRFSLFSSGSGLKPSEGKTIPDPEKEKAYSWLKAPRYQGNVMEVGPLARILVAYYRGQKDVKALVKKTLAQTGLQRTHLVSLLGRHLARALETKLVADRCAEWVQQLDPGKPCFTDFQIPATGSGIGLTEAPRGALGHWLAISDHKISNYQCVVPTTWNCSPRDDKSIPGAVEQALIGTPIADAGNPIEAARVVRSFDPCIACAVH